MIGRVYKIIVNCSNECYVGSTFQECRAKWQDHKDQYTKWKKNGNVDKISSYELFDKYGLKNCKIILIREYEVVDRQHLEIYEQLWINKLKPINKCSSFRIKKLYMKQYHEKHKEQHNQKCREYYQEHREELSEKSKVYYQEHKEERNQQSKEYHQKNREEISKQKKEYNEKHKEQLNQQSKEYYQKNREKILQKVVCECGTEVNKSSLSRHKKSKKHQEFMKTLS